MRSTTCWIAVCFGGSILFSGCAEMAHPERVLNKVKQMKLPSVSELTSRTPVTTTFDDALTEVPLLDGFSPRFTFPLSAARRVGEGRFALYPGAYSLDARSYCLRAGTYGPGDGTGYLPAPLKGPKADLVKAILSRANDHPEIPQQQIQLLLWAIIARLQLSEMSPELQATASALLTPKERFELNGGILGLVPDATWAELESQLPSELREIYRVEQKLRQQLASSLQSFEEVERYAVLTGIAPLMDELRKVPRGRWAYRKGGFFVRYFPSSYSRTRVEVFVPRPVAIERGESGRIRRLSAPDLGSVEADLSLGGAESSGVATKIDQALSTTVLSQMLLSLGASPTGEGLQRLTELSRLRAVAGETRTGDPAARAAVDEIFLNAQAFEICVQAGDCTAEHSPETPRDFDLPATLAVPASRSGQRLGISDQPAVNAPVDCNPLQGESVLTFCDREKIYDRWSQIARNLDAPDDFRAGSRAVFKSAQDTAGLSCSREKPSSSAAVDKEINELSKAVFEANRLKCNELVKRRKLVDPFDENLPVGGSLPWALRYVEYEQCVAGRYLTGLKKRSPKLHASVIKSQNDWSAAFSNPEGDGPQAWASGVLNGKLNLDDYSHRATIGYAGVYHKLGKTREEYKAFFKESKAPARCPGN